MEPTPHVARHLFPRTRGCSATGLCCRSVLLSVLSCLDQVSLWTTVQNSHDRHVVRLLDVYEVRMNSRSLAASEGHITLPCCQTDLLRRLCAHGRLVPRHVGRVVLCLAAVALLSTACLSERLTEHLPLLPGRRLPVSGARNLRGRGPPGAYEGELLRYEYVLPKPGGELNLHLCSSGGHLHFPGLVKLTDLQI